MTKATINLVYSGTAQNGVDYTNDVTSIQINNGTTGTATITSIGDTSVETNETIIVGITSATSAVESTEQQQTLSIINDDFATVSLSVDQNSFTENAGTSTVTATLDKVTFEDVTVNIGYTGTATNGTDYATPTGTIIITAGQTTGTTTLTATDDAIVESDETIIIDITGVSGGSASENGYPTANCYYYR